MRLRANMSVWAAILGAAATVRAVEPLDARAGFDVRALLVLPAEDAPSTSLVPSLRLDRGAGGTSAPTAPPGGNIRRYVMPVVLSAAVPGAGEIATGHWLRGLPLLAADVATWIGKAHFESEGRDWRDRYEAFADAHWSYARWQDSLSVHFDSSQPEPGLRWWNPEAPYNCNCPYVPKEEDRQHYYENIGKYRYYWPGWEDWSYNTTSPRDSDSASMRRQYGDMRIESNDNFDDANALVVVAMANRLLSVVQTVFLVRGDLRHERLTVSPMKMSGMGAGMAMRLRY